MAEHRALARIALGAGLLLLLAGCAPSIDPEETRDSLTEVTESPVQPDAATELDSELHPDPIVDPLDCSPYLVITVRGTGEPTKGQLLSPVARAISDARPGSVQTVDLDYPANTDVKEGGTVGARTLIDTLNLQTESCEEQRFVVLGYSQGALIVGDALAAPESRLVGPTVGEVTAAAAERILAVVLYGNPRFVGGESYNAGSYRAQTNGLLPRPLGSLQAYADRIRDYCVARDFVCQSSLDLDEQGHISYYDNGMQQDGAAFVITRLGPPLDEPAQAEEAESDADPEAAADDGA
ncbi:MAG: cutinase family protein [Leucobacter sp.]